jgi:hypothetical protein
MKEETVMVNKIKLVLVLAALAALLTPSLASAYGAAHVGYTHVGPNGVYHEGATVGGGAGGYGGSYHAGYAGGYGGTTHVGYESGYHVGPEGGVHGGYTYNAGYSGGAGYGATNYRYIR